MQDPRPPISLAIGFAPGTRTRARYACGQITGPRIESQAGRRQQRLHRKTPGRWRVEMRLRITTTPVMPLGLTVGIMACQRQLGV
jgi:hypothetical protein